MNKRKSLQSVEGRKFMKEKILQLSTINEYTTCHILSNYGKIKFLEEPHKKAVISDLKEILAKIDPKKATSVYNTLKKLLKGL
jgi:aminopeptidase N